MDTILCAVDLNESARLVMDVAGSLARSGAHACRSSVCRAPEEATPRRLGPVRTVLVTTDFSPFGNAAIQEAYRLLLRGGGDVILFHVAEPGPFGLDPDRRNEIETCLLALVPNGMDICGIRTRTSVVADRSPGDAIVQAIRRIGPDLVVMSSHGRSGLRRAIRGSVAEHVMRTAAKPVLVVPTSFEVPDDSPENQL